MRGVPGRPCVLTVAVLPPLAVLAAAILTACGSATSPSSSGGVTVVSRTTGSIGASGATITITASGVSPSSVTISTGQSVTFINNDTRSHEMDSDPHPQHGSCPSIDIGVGLVAPGQTKLTQGFMDAGTCGFHDHQDANNAGLKGSIVIR